MARVKVGVTTRARHKKMLKMAKGYRGRARSCYSVAKERVEKGLIYAYRDRKNRKREFRALWIVRINAAVREHGMKYSSFMAALKVAGLDLNRKMLAELAIRETQDFAKIVEIAKKAVA